MNSAASHGHKGGKAYLRRTVFLKDGTKLCAITPRESLGTNSVVPHYPLGTHKKLSNGLGAATSRNAGVKKFASSKDLTNLLYKPIKKMGSRILP